MLPLNHLHNGYQQFETQDHVLCISNIQNKGVFRDGIIPGMNAGHAKMSLKTGQGFQQKEKILKTDLHHPDAIIKTLTVTMAEIGHLTERMPANQPQILQAIQKLQQIVRSRRQSTA